MPVKGEHMDFPPSFGHAHSKIYHANTAHQESHQLPIFGLLTRLVTHFSDSKHGFPLGGLPPGSSDQAGHHQLFKATHKGC